MREIEERHWWFRARQDILLELVRRWLPPGRTILDVGCGTGYFLEQARKVWDVWGVDPAPEAVAYCRQRGLTNVLMGMADLEIDGLPRADAVCFFDVLEHLDDDVAALKAASDRLTPDGLIFATVPAYQWLWSSHDVVNHHRRRYTRQTLRSSLEKAGLEPALLGYYNSRLFPLALAARLADKSRKGSREDLLPIPSPRANQMLYRVFRSEKRRLTGQPGRPFRFGLSLLVVARKKSSNR
jgi:SAM-dependent methyltransferase